MSDTLFNSDVLIATVLAAVIASTANVLQSDEGLDPYAWLVSLARNALAGALWGYFSSVAFLLSKSDGEGLDAFTFWLIFVAGAIAAPYVIIWARDSVLRRLP